MMDDDERRVDRGRAVYSSRRRVRTRDGRRLSPAGNVLLALLVGLTIGLFLNATTMQKGIKTQNLGAKRTLGVVAIAPFAKISHLLYIDRPRQWADSAMGKGEGSEKAAEEALADLGAPTKTPKPKPSESGGTGTEPAVLPTPTKSQPLRAWVGGDSQTQVFGQALVDKMLATKVMKATLKYVISSGLSRPDFYDWPGNLRKILGAAKPDVAVMMFGANDAQGVEYKGKVLDYGTPAWVKLYHERVGEAMDIALENGARVYWVGQPISRLTDYNPRLQLMNKVYEEEAAKRENVVFMSTWDLFKDSKGNYNDYLKNDSGDIVLMRQSDGIHLSLEGGDRMSQYVLDQIEKDYHLSEQ
jgi:uncharacterized protein